MRITSNMNKSNTAIFLILGLVFIAGVFLLVKTDTVWIQTVAAIPTVGALAGALFQLVRDDAAYKKQREIQNAQNVFTLGASSHMATVAFDKHIEFCEQYMELIHELIDSIMQHGPSTEQRPKVIDLLNLRKRYAAWTTKDMEAQLKPFEDALVHMTSLSGLVERNRQTEAGDKAIDDLYKLSSEILQLDGNELALGSDVSIGEIRERVRKMLGIEEISEMRKAIVEKSIAYIRADA